MSDHRFIPYSELHKHQIKSMEEKDFEKFESYMSDSSYENTVEHKDGLFCLYDGMSGKYMIVGVVLHKCDCDTVLGDKPIPLTIPDDANEIKDSIVSIFGIDASESQLYFVTKYS